MFYVAIVWPSDGETETHKLYTVEECIGLLTESAERDEFVSFAITYVEPTETELDARVTDGTVYHGVAGSKVRD
jgi:hypothetical protein